MLQSIRIFTDKPVTKSRKEAIIDILRASIINVCKNKHYNTFTEDSKRLIDFRPPPPYETLPTILYGQPTPGTKRFDIYGYGNTGKEILIKMAQTLKKVGNLKFYHPNSSEPFREIGITGWELKEGLPFLPTMLQNEAHYYTATPMILFDKSKKFNLWFALKKKLEQGVITQDEADKIIKEVIVFSLKGSLVTHLKQHIKDKEYAFVNDIDIKIKEYSFAMMFYHKEQPRTPFLRMKFTSNWSLPLFMGHHTGKGYGMILLDKEKMGEK